MQLVSPWVHGHKYGTGMDEIKNILTWFGHVMRMREEICLKNTAHKNGGKTTRRKTQNNMYRANLKGCRSER
jgi:hypothetical protein